MYGISISRCTLSPSSETNNLTASQLEGSETSASCRSRTLIFGLAKDGLRIGGNWSSSIHICVYVCELIQLLLIEKHRCYVVIVKFDWLKACFKQNISHCTSRKIISEKQNKIKKSNHHLFLMVNFHVGLSKVLKPALENNPFTFRPLSFNVLHSKRHILS